mgnify:CR=1 FL=1
MKKSDEIQIIEEFFDIIQNYTENNTVYYDDIQVFYKVLQILDRKIVDKNVYNISVMIWRRLSIHLV